MLGLYLHIPFCGKICDYCDFFAIQAPIRLYEEYVGLVSREIQEFASRNPGRLEAVETLYLGGGTPSILPPELLSRLFLTLQSVGVPLKTLKEATMEFNPESCEPERLAVAMEYGVNRVSVGIQTFDGDLLTRIGRSHTGGVGRNALDLLVRTPGLRVSADLMFNLPGQSLEGFLNDLDRLSDYPLGHVSFYGLKVDPSTRLGVRIARGKESVDEDLYAPMYMRGVDLLAQKGFERYETSNFARFGEESLHNLNYWRRGEYLAFGPGAHGFLDGIRFFAPEMYAKWREYVRAGCPRNMLTLDPIGDEERIAEYLQLSFRTKFGMSLETLKSLGRRVPASIVDKWVSKGYLECKDGELRLIGEGWLFMDGVVGDIYSNLE